MGSSFTSWDGVQAYFTFFTQPDAIDVILILSVLATVFAIVASIKHENESYIDYRE
jgi:hypothetical protein